MLALLLSARARIAESRVPLSLLASWIEAWVSASSPLISVSVSRPSAAPIAGNKSSSAAPCSSLAAARRTARCGAVSLSAAIAVPSSLRIRLLMTTSSRLSGSGVTASPVTRSVPASPLTHKTRASPTVCTSPSSNACSNGSAEASPLDASALIAFALASLSPKASSRTVSGATAPALQASAVSTNAANQRMITTTRSS